MKFRYFAGYANPVLTLFHKIHSFLNRNYFGGVRILLYHHIPENKIELFKKQLHYLSNKYHFITPSQFQGFVNGEHSFSDLKLLITFDDGFKSNRLVAEEILQPLGIKAIFFVSTDFIELLDSEKQKRFITQKIYNFKIAHFCVTSDMRPLTWKDLEYLVKQGHSIGSHTKSHSRLSALSSKDKLCGEIIESGDILERKLKIPITCFAYPFGDIDSINKSAMDLIKERYKYCFSGIRGANYYPVYKYAIFRDSISIDDPPQYLRLIMENGLDIVYRKKARRLIKLTRDNFQ